MAIPLQVAIDCANPKQLAAFWVAALDYKIQDPHPPTEFASWDAFLESQQISRAEWNDFSVIADPDKKGPRIYFQLFLIKHLDFSITHQYT